MKKNVVLTVVSSLLIGFVLGFFLSGRLAHNRVKQMNNSFDKPNKEKVRLMNKLNLSETQTEVVGPILDSFLIEQKAIRHEYRTKLKSQRSEMFSSIEPELTPKQLKRLNRIRNRKRGRNKK